VLSVASSATFAGGGLTYYNLSFTSATGLPIITGANTFNNLTVAAPTTQGSWGNTVTFPSGVTTTVTGTLTLSAGATVLLRRTIKSDTLGTAATISTASSPTLQDLDFVDITATGAGGTWSGTRLGDLGGNTGITTSTPKTVYWNLTGATVSLVSTAWATTSTGTPAINNFPLPQDTATFTDTGVSASSIFTLTSTFNIPSLDFSARTTAMTITISNATYYLYGDVIFYSNITVASSGASTVLNFQGRSKTQNLNTAAKTLTVLGNGININCIGGSLKLAGNTTFSLSVFSVLTHNNGTLDLNGYTLTLSLSSSSNTFNMYITAGTAAKTIAFGTGNITISGTGVLWDTSASTGLTITGTPVVNITDSGATARTITTGTLSETNSISFNISAGTGNLTLTASGTYRNLDFTGFTGTLLNNSITIYGNLTLASGATYTAGGSAWTFGATYTGAKTITTNAKTMDFPITFNGVGGYWALQDNLTMGSGRTLTHTNGVLDLNGKTLTVGTAYTTAAGVKNLTFNGGTLVCPTASTTAFNNAVPTGYTTSAGTGTGTISMTAATAKTFVGGGSIFNCTLSQDGAGTLTISGANTFINITNTVNGTTITFPASTTNTFSNFNLNGAAANLTTINSSTAGVASTLAKTPGTVSCDYLSVKDLTVNSTVAKWYAGANSTNVSGNTGWTFTALVNSLVTRLTNNGVLFVNSPLDEITKSGISLSTNGIYAVVFDEVTINPINSGVAQRQLLGGTLQVANTFDEVTGAL
jgi:hypothetical protein